jgi:prephenate dehydratase
MSRLKIGIQGVAASFHDVAAKKFFTNQPIDVVECPSFKILSENLADKRADFCMMAIENTIAGSILTNYSLLERYEFKILGEVYLPISMSLMALPGHKIQDIKFIQSHPMALFQCEEFLFQHPQIKVLEAADTAESAKNISEKKLMGYGAIASPLAAETYGLEILKEGIETNKLNYTRFFAICRSEDYVIPKNTDKVSLRFETAHEPGSLVKALSVLKDNKINLTKIQSIPILGKPYQYSIHVDAEWNDHEDFLRGLEQLKKVTANLFQFGEYKKGERL